MNESGGNNPRQVDKQVSLHPVDALIREIIHTRRAATDDEIARIIDRMANAPFDERIIAVRLQFRGVTYRGQTLGNRERAVFLHLIQRVVVEEQWADGIGEREYVEDLRTAIVDSAARLCVYERRGGAVAAVFTRNWLPMNHRGPDALPFVFVIYSADRGKIISGYQASDVNRLSTSEDVQWLK